MRRFSVLSGIILSCLAASLSRADFPDVPLSFDPARITTTDASLSVRSGTAPVLVVVTGHREVSPGIALHAPGGQWDISPFFQLLMQVKNTGVASVTLQGRVDNPGADGTKNCVSGTSRSDPARRAPCW